MFDRARAKIQDPVAMRRFNGWSLIFFIFLAPVAQVTGLVNSVPFVSWLSIVALQLSALSAWVASRVEVKQHEQEQESTTPSPGG